MGMLGLSLTMGCPGFFVYPGSLNGSGTSSTGDYVYVANATTDSVAGFAVGTGTLASVAGSPFQVPYSPTAVAVNPADSILFVAGINGIYAYSIASGTGVLTVLNNGLAATSAYVVAMDISPDGNWLLGLDGNGTSIDEFEINSSTGGLSQAVSTSYSATAITPRAIKFAPNGELVFVALGTAGDMVYTFTTATTSGALTNPQSFATLTSPMSDNGLAVNPSSTTLYIARSSSTSDGTVAAYTIGANGSVTLAPVALGTTGVQPTAVVVNAAGTYVYVANRSDSTVSGFSTTAVGGVLPVVTGSPFGAGSEVTALAVDKSGDYLLAVANGGSHDLTMYSFDATAAGKLDSSTSTATGTDPTGPVAIAATH